MVTQVSRVTSLEQSGHWRQALYCLRDDIRSEVHSDAEIWHRLGRLHQRLGQSKAGRSSLFNRASDRCSPAPHLQQPCALGAGPSQRR